MVWISPEISLADSLANIISAESVDVERRTFSINALSPDAPAVLLNDPVADAESQAGTLSDIFRGEEWLEDSMQIF